MGNTEKTISKTKKAVRNILKKTEKRSIRNDTKTNKHSEAYLENEKEEYDAVKDCITMRFDLNTSLDYLKNKNFKMGKEKFRSFKNLIKEEKLKFFHQLALDSGMVESNANVINSFQLIEKEQWKLYHREDDLTKKSMILTRITELQVYLADSIDVSKEIIREQAEIKESMTPETEKNITV